MAAHEFSYCFIRASIVLSRHFAKYIHFELAISITYNEPTQRPTGGLISFASIWQQRYSTVACSGLSIDLGVALYSTAPLVNLYQRSCFNSFAFLCTDFFPLHILCMYWTNMTACLFHYSLQVLITRRYNHWRCCVETRRLKPCCQYLA